MDLEHYGFTAHYGQHYPMERSHRHNNLEINFIVDGAMTYFVAGQQITVQPRTTALFWAAIPHQVIHWEAPVWFYWVTVPLDYFLKWDLPESFRQKVLQGHLLSDPTPNNPEMDRSLFEQWFNDLHSDTTACKKVTMLEIEARVRRLSFKLDNTDVQPSTSMQPEVDGRYTHAARIARYISEHYREPLTIQCIANAVGLHPNYAMNTFKSGFAMSIVEYITQHRVSFAQRRLLTKEESIETIAMEAGFGSLSQFYLAFQRLCGQPPGRYRASMQKNQNEGQQRGNTRSSTYKIANALGTDCGICKM